MSFIWSLKQTLLASHIYESGPYLQIACVLRDKLCPYSMCHFKLAWHFQNIILSNICVNKNNISVHLNHKLSVQNVIQREIIMKQKMKQHLLLHYPTALERCRVYLPLSPDLQLLHFITALVFPLMFLFSCSYFFQNTYTSTC